MINYYFQKYHTYTLYGNSSNDRFNIVAFYRRLFDLLTINDFDGTNAPYLAAKGGHGIIMLGLIELSLHNRFKFIDASKVFQNLNA